MVKEAIIKLNELANIQPTIRDEVFQLLLEKKLDKATEKIVEFILEREYIYSIRDENKPEVWIYQNGVYVPKGKSVIKEVCRSILGRAYTDTRAKHVIDKIVVDTGIDEEEFFKDDLKDEIAVENGILNIKTKKLSDFTPKKIFFNKIPVKFNPNAKCPIIEKFLSDVLKDEDDKKIIDEVAGYALYRDHPVEKAIMGIGDGRNGKGKTLELLKRFVGAENCCSVPLSAMQYNTSALCELHNRLLNLGGDLSPTSLKEMGLFKQLTGRDILQVKRKYLRDLIFMSYAKNFFACNELPKVYDKSVGFWSRWIVLEFPYRFVKQKEFDLLSEKDKEFCKIMDPLIIDKISTPEELSGFLNNALEGLDRLLKQKDFSYTKGSKEVMEFWVRKSDSFMAFCMDCLEESEDGFIPKDMIRKKYTKYRKKFKLKAESDISIKITLQQMFGADEQRKMLYDCFDYDSPSQQQKSVWVGIKFKEGVI